VGLDHCAIFARSWRSSTMDTRGSDGSYIQSGESKLGASAGSSYILRILYQSFSRRRIQPVWACL
jgi:hypothetical protein